MKVAVIGSRTFNDYELLKLTLSKYNITTIISGGAKGADLLSEQYAGDFEIPTLIFKPDWVKHGRGAGFIRNKDIINECDFAITFWDGTSKGTLHSINLAKRQNKTVIIVEYNKPTNYFIF